MKDTFRILSIDGGGIRGIFPAQIFSEIDSKLRDEGKPESLYQYFDLIVGTSTGGVIALALSLGIPANEIVQLYSENAKKIFKKYRVITNVKSFYMPTYSSRHLEKTIRKKFLNRENGIDFRMHDAKTRLCIPSFRGAESTNTVYKTRHLEEYIHDFHLPAYQVAMATSAAPVYFRPYSMNYKKINQSESYSIARNIDGGVYANNPTLIALTEASAKLGIDYSKIRILSVGTGTKKYNDSISKLYGSGKYYWIAKQKLFDLLMHTQSEHVNDLISLMLIGLPPEHRFLYERINFDLTDKIELDCTNETKLKTLREKATYLFQQRAEHLMKDFFLEPAIKFQPLN